MSDVDLDLILVIELATSGAKVGAVRGGKVAGPLRLPRADGRAVAEMARPLLQGKQAVVAIAGSEAPKLEGMAWEVRKLRLGPVLTVAPSHAGLPTAKVREPLKAGLDRRAQILAATHLAAEATAVVSCGSALTVDVGDESGALIGGAILPGLALGAKALASLAARLPNVALEGSARMPGQDTQEAIRAGLLVGAAGAVEHLLETGGVESSRPVYLTGGDARFIEPHLLRPVRPMPGLCILGVALAVRAAPPTRWD